MEWNKERIHALRKKLNVKQKDFAEILGLSRQQTISLWERGDAKPQRATRILLTQCWEKLGSPPLEM